MNRPAGTDRRRQDSEGHGARRDLARCRADAVSIAEVFAQLAGDDQDSQASGTAEAWRSLARPAA
jgi:hypothetical protein